MDAEGRKLDEMWGEGITKHPDAMAEFIKKQVEQQVKQQVADILKNSSI
jgi:hypothetical protein